MSGTILSHSRLNISCYISIYEVVYGSIMCWPIIPPHTFSFWGYCVCCSIIQWQDCLKIHLGQKVALSEYKILFATFGISLDMSIIITQNYILRSGSLYVAHGVLFIARTNDDCLILLSNCLMLLSITRTITSRAWSLFFSVSESWNIFYMSIS